MSNWVYLPPWSVTALALLVTSLLVLVGIRAWRERRRVPLRRQGVGLFLRYLALGALTWVGLNPTAMQPRKQPGKPKLIVLLDTSYSMSTSDVAGEGRLATALTTLRAQQKKLAKNFQLDLRVFDQSQQPASLNSLTTEAAKGTASDLTSAIASCVGELSSSDNQAGVVLISDGRATHGHPIEAAQLALARSIPLWTWCLGGDVPRRDLWIEVPGNEVLAFAEDEVELPATLHQVGYDDRSFTVEVLTEGKVIQKLEATPGPSGKAAVRVKVKAPEVGETQYTFRVPPDADEAETRNNERSIFLQAVGKKVRILLVEGQPHWDSKFLVQCLKRNPRVDLTAVYRLGKGREFAVVSTAAGQRREAKDLFPRTAKDFGKYDVILLGRGCESFFDEKSEDHLTHFVAQRGGGLVFTRGKGYGGRFQPLSKLEPIVWDRGYEAGVKLTPTASGRSTPLFELTAPDDLDALLSRLPRFDQILRTKGIKPLAVTLAESKDESTIMSYHLYGQGRVVSLNASGLWRWSFREKGESADEFIYDRFWLGLMRWLLSGSDFLAGHDVALRTDRRLYTDEQNLQLLVRTRGLDQKAYRPRLRIEGKAGVTTLEPQPQSGGSFLAQAGPFSPGNYRILLENNIGHPKELSQTIEVISASVENRILSADPSTMKKLAEVSEAQVLQKDDIGRLNEIVKAWRARRELADQKISLWDRWWILAIILVLLGLEWFLRRQEGLL